MASRPIKKIIHLGKGYVAHHQANSVYIYNIDAARVVKDVNSGMEIAQLACCAFGAQGGQWFKSRFGHSSDIPYFIREFKRTYHKRLKHGS